MTGTNDRTPRWARELVAEVWSDRTGPAPTITWRDGRRWGSSGSYVTEEHRIVITASERSPRLEHEQTLLHELAHARTPMHHHDDAFWIEAWRLYFRFGVVTRELVARERRYRKGSEVARLQVKAELEREAEREAARAQEWARDKHGLVVVEKRVDGTPLHD